MIYELWVYALSLSNKDPVYHILESPTFQELSRVLVNISSQPNNGNAMHAVRSFECRPILRPYFWPLLTSFWFHAGFFFSFLCIWDVAHLNCHPLLPNVDHFYPFSIPHIELSPLWGP